MKQILFLALAATSLFACNKEDATDAEISTGKNTVAITIEQAASTRGVSNQIGDPEYSVIGSARIYFINSSGTNIYQRDLTSAEILALANTQTTPGGNTIVVTGVPSTAQTLYFVANIQTTDGVSYPVVDGTTPTDARLRIDRLQADALHVPMAGRSGTFVQGVGNNYSTSVVLTPLVARIEVGKVTCQNQNGASANPVSADITGYKLSGVFINNIHQAVLLDGTPYLVGSPLDIKAQVGWTTSVTPYFNSNNTVFPYYPGGSVTVPSDWVENSMVTFCSPANAAMSFYPDLANGATNVDPNVTPKKAWGYQVCPSVTVPVGTAFDLPHIILKLTSVTYNNNPLGLPVQYVTVTKYKDSQGNPVSLFQRGNVYRIQNLTFTHNEATNNPYDKNISVTATVTVAPWVINNINPDWN